METRQSSMKYLLAFLISLAAIYMVWAFVLLSWDFRQWEENSRFGLVLVGLPISVLITCIVVTIPKNKAA